MFPGTSSAAPAKTPKTAFCERQTQDRPLFRGGASLRYPEHALPGITGKHRAGTECVRYKRLPCELPPYRRFRCR